MESSISSRDVAFKLNKSRKHFKNSANIFLIKPKDSILRFQLQYQKSISRKIWAQINLLKYQVCLKDGFFSFSKNQENIEAN